MDEQIQEKRRALRRKRKRRMRRLLITAILLILALIIGGITAFLHKMKQGKEVTKEEPIQKQEEVVVPEIVIEQKKEVQITISAAGDCTLATDINYNQGATFVAEYNKVQNPAHFLEKVQSAFANDDLTIVNMEGVFTESNNRADKTFAFKGDPEYVNIFTQGSVEAVNLANNHSRDYGMESLADTRKVLDEAGIVHFGYDQTAVMEIKDTKVGLVGIYEQPYGIGCKEQLLTNIQKVKDEGAALIIVSFHWGTEREYYPNNVQVELAHAAIDAGADLVLGHHPHVLQGIETYKGKKICYSLGNFCFGGNKNPSDKDTMIFQQTFTLIDDQVVLDENVTILPCSISSVSERNNFQPTILTGDEAARIMGRIQEFSQGLSTE